MTRRTAALLALLLAAAPAAGQDVREAARKAEADRQAALAQVREVEARILADRGALVTEVEKLEAEERSLQAAIDALEGRLAAGEQRHEQLNERWSTMEMDFREISGNVRVVARDLESVLIQSPTTALAPQRIERLQPILNPGYFPDIDDIVAITSTFFDEMRRSGQVGFVDGIFAGRDGENREGRILTLGKFTALYRDGGEIGFLNYKPEGRQYYALSTLPSGWIARNLKRYMEGKSADVVIDISGGAALRQITQRWTFSEHLRKGGPLMLPIVAVALLAAFLVVSKVIFLNAIHRKTGKYMGRVNLLAAQGDWAECEAIIARHKGEHSPVNHVLEAGVRNRHQDRETLESILQESILRELPRVERGLSMLAVLGAVAPLLGLLGTVTGMIDTFRVITLHGTGDPKLMSGGISEALITTEFGLYIAIPIMIAHTMLSRRADRIVGEMEENAVSLINTIEKEKKSRHERMALASA